MKKRWIKLLTAGALTLGLAACSSSSDTSSDTSDSETTETTEETTEDSSESSDDTSDDDSSTASEDTELVTITVGATTAPHAEILEQAVELMKEKGYDLQITEFSDYPNINPATSDGSLDANYFQHEPYLISYDADAGYESGDDGYLVSAGAIHYEPLGLYSDSKTSVDEVEDGDIILVPNDATNEARALFLLQDLGLITLNDDAAIETATTADIAENPHNLTIKEVNADQVATLMADGDYAVINGNYALAAGVTDKLITTESADSEAAKTYANVIAVKESRKDDPAVVALVEVLKSDEIKNWITETYGVSVVPAE